MQFKLPASVELLRQQQVDPAAGDAPDREKIAELAEQFESMLLLQMIRQMRSSMLDEEEHEGEGFGQEVFTDTIDIEVAQHLSRSGGLGLRDVVVEAFDRQMGLSPAPNAGQPADPLGLAVGVPTGPTLRMPPVSRVSAVPAGISATPGPGMTHAAGEASADRVVDGRVTSPFGWRRDPFHGHSKFHAGVDLKAAYGTEVPTVSGGTVTFAGEQGAYGLTVVVDHGHGLTTRYAHLSEVGVAAGQALSAGQVVGRVGQSGRATGPHLHFEVFREGRAIDPTRAAEHFGAAGLKLVALDVD